MIKLNRQFVFTSLGTYPDLINNVYFHAKSQGLIITPSHNNALDKSPREWFAPTVLIPDVHFFSNFFIVRRGKSSDHVT